ncbi:MAG TPA: hypothetical protein VNA16_04725 [Abditibacteriaceae bacterium]|nr:hypothetical protein [Abditibacteriaceae bacterium]
MNQRRTRGVAVLSGGIVAAAALLPGLFVAAPAHAVDKKTYKTGAIVLGAASAYLLLKGKTLPGAVAGAGAYYAYKKSKKASSDQYSQYPGDRYSQGQDVYPAEDYGYYPGDTGYDGQYSDGRYPNGGQYPNYGFNGAVSTSSRTAKRDKAPRAGTDGRTVLK